MDESHPDRPSDLLGLSRLAIANRMPATAGFGVPANQEKGPSQLEVVTNGVASEPIHVNVR